MVLGGAGLQACKKLLLMKWALAPDVLVELFVPELFKAATLRADKPFHNCALLCWVEQSFRTAQAEF